MCSFLPTSRDLVMLTGHWMYWKLALGTPINQSFLLLDNSRIGQIIFIKEMKISLIAVLKIDEEGLNQFCKKKNKWKNA